jgi:hypothetical protein
MEWWRKAGSIAPHLPIRRLLMTEVGDPQKQPIQDVYPKLAALVANDDIHTGEVAGDPPESRPEEDCIRTGVLSGP